MKGSNPWDSASVWKNEKDFLNWLRSQTRRIWNRHPVKTSYKQSRRFKAPIGVNQKEVWATKCEMCCKTVRSGQAQVDHIQEGGSFSDWESYSRWSKRILWVGHDDIRELCKECHEAVTLSQRKGITVEAARIEKAVIAKTKQPTNKQKKELLAHGFSEEETRNAAARRGCYRRLLSR